MDIIPPHKKPVPPPVTPSKPPQAPKPPMPVKQTGLPGFARKRRFSWRWWVFGLLGAVLLAIIAANVWYFSSLQPLKPGSGEKIRVKVTTGESVVEIAANLRQAGVIRSSTVFRIYAELSGNKGKLKAGGYTVSPAQSVPDIIDHLASGNTDDLIITIPPGVSTIGIREQLRKYGYSDQEITAALQAEYGSPLLADKPADVGLDGYIFPETFKVDPNETVESLFKRSFDELYGRLVQAGLIDKFRSHNLNIHQALTLASIVQKEVTDPADQRQVAQVFYSRLAEGAMLGSDVTYIYAANQLGIEPSVNIDSPYNTRKYAGLPPGPIANMNFSALEAVADPAPGDYLYFVAGDDGKTYFSRTLDEHLENVKKHCSDLCN